MSHNRGSLQYEALANCGEIERKRIEDRLQTLDDRMQKRRHEWAPHQDWLINAEIEHLPRPFHAILAKTNPRLQDFVLEGDSINETHLLWNVTASQVVPREALKMAACVAPLLRVCREILFIDPHFGPENLRHRRPLEAFLDAMLDRRDDEIPERIEIHLSDKAEASFFQMECNRRLPLLIPEKVKVRLVRWKQRDGGEKLHNRFILTDRGGVRFGVGLDDGQEGETDEVELLGEPIYKVRWAQYTSAPAFDLVDELVIVGRRVLHTKKIHEIPPHR